MDLYKQNQYFTTAINVSGGIDDTQTTGIIIQDDSGIYDKTAPGIALLSYASPLDTDVSEWITFSSVNTTTKELNGVTRGAEGFSAKSHANGSVVAFPHSKSHVNNLVEMFTEKGLELTKLDSTPTTPDTGKTKIYVGDGTTDSNNTIVILTDTGAKTEIQASGYSKKDRQALINGNMEIAQRYTSKTQTGSNAIAYNVDRFFSQAYVGSGGSGSNSITVSRQSFSPGQTDVPGNPAYYARLLINSVGTSGAGAFIRINQKIEDVNSFSGETITVSGYIKATTSRTAAVCLVQNFGTGGSPSAETSTVGETINITSSWSKFETTLSVPSISGKTIGTDGKNTSYLGINIVLYKEDDDKFESPSGTIGYWGAETYDFAQLVVNKGATALPIPSESTSENLRKCQRYYEKSFNLKDAPTAATYSSSQGLAAAYTTTVMRVQQIPYRVKKVKIPTVTYYSDDNSTGSNWAYYNGSTWVSVSVSDSDRKEDYIATISLNGSGFTVGRAYPFAGHWVADAEL